MKSIFKTSDLVKDILERVPQARNSDRLLYYEVCVAIDRSVLRLPFGVVLLDPKSNGLPEFKTVERARRKIQKERPELAASADVKSKRTENEAKFRDYARKGVV